MKYLILFLLFPFNSFSQEANTVFQFGLDGHHAYCMIP